jgi:glycosyltransferase involved in cell wall biosynthesis
MNSSSLRPLDEAEPFVSVVIPAFNEEKHIRSCIQSVISNHYPADLREVIVVDNGSTDRTVEIAKDCGAEVLEMPGASLGKIRNEGARRAKGSVIAFIDADCTADQSWIRSGVFSLSLDSCITGSRVEVPEGAGWIEFAWFKGLSGGRQEASHINTANLFVERRVFEELCGFSEAIRTGEDTEFSERAKKLVKVIDDDRIRVIHHGNPNSIADFLRREIWHGLGAFGSYRVKRLDKPLLGTFCFLFLTVLQGLGLLSMVAGGVASFFYLATGGVIFLLLATLWYRRKSFQSILHVCQLFVLYYLFYLARSISLLYLILGRPYYHSIKK